LKILLSY